MPSAKRVKWKETTKVSCLPNPQQCGCEEMSLAAIMQNARDEFSHQLVCACGNSTFKKFHANSTHLPFTCRRVSEVHKRSSGPPLIHRTEAKHPVGRDPGASKLGANYAEAAAKQKMLENLKEEDEAALTLPFMVRLNSIQIPLI